MPDNEASGRLFSILLSILGVILIITTSYLIYKQHRPSQIPGAEIFLKAQRDSRSELKYEGHPETLPGIIKPIARPPIAAQLPVPTGAAQAALRETADPATESLGRTPARAPKFTANAVKYDVGTISNAPKAEVMLNSAIYADITTTVPSEETAFTVPVVSTPDDPPVGQEGIVGTQLRAARSSAKPKGLTMIKNISAADNGLSDVAQAVTIGRLAVEPLPKGEPGGRVVGRGKDIQGVFRLVRAHHDLADWWADQSSLVALTEWLNTQTRIKTDMNVEGGALRLSDPKISKAPLVFFTGHDPAQVGRFELIRGAPLRNRLSKQERDGIRRYLVEDGGFIYFDDCGVNAPAEAFVRLVMAQLRYALPEYSVDRIPNAHEIYNNYYDTGGPPVGFDIFWWGTHPPKRNFLEGITVGERLAALICRRDYMCSMETMSIPGRAIHYSPGVYRFSTNVVVYALTHGGISDYSKYIPADTVTDRIPIDVPTVVPELK